MSTRHRWEVDRLVSDQYYQPPRVFTGTLERKSVQIWTPKMYYRRGYIC